MAVHQCDHLHKWRRGWVSMMVSPHCWDLNRGCWQFFPPCSGQIWRSDSRNDSIMSINIAGLACTVLSSTRRRPHYNRSPGCQPSELPLMVGAQQHHQPLVNRIKSIRPRADQDDVEIECKLVTHLFLPGHSHSLPTIDLGHVFLLGTYPPPSSFPGGKWLWGSKWHTARSCVGWPGRALWFQWMF